MDDLINQWHLLPKIDQVLWLISLVSNFFLIVYYLLEFAGHNADLDIPDHDDAFSVLSLRGLLAFGTFMGWSAILVRRGGGSVVEALVVGTVAGLFAAWLVWKMLRLLLRMQSSGAALDMKKLVGSEATVYLVVPGGGEKTGKIHLSVQGALREFDVVTSEKTDLPTGSKVIVSDIREDGVPVVVAFSEPVFPLPSEPPKEKSADAIRSAFDEVFNKKVDG